MPEYPKITLKWLDKNQLEPKQNLIQKAFENNLNLKGQKFNIEKYHSELAYAKIEQMPNLNIHGQIQDSSGSSSNQASNGMDYRFQCQLLTKIKKKYLAPSQKLKHKINFMNLKKINSKKLLKMIFCNIKLN